MGWLVVAALLGALDAGQPPRAAEDLLRQVVAETALAQLREVSPDWEPAQRDCAGLVRFAYRAAFAKLAPQRLRTPLWNDRGTPVAFADAATLIRDNFVALGRHDVARDQLKSGDLLAFRQPGETLHGEPQYHLMVAVVTPRAVWVVYHPGDGGQVVRWGALRDLLHPQAPKAWRPVPENPAFVGYLRLKEWAHGNS